MAYLNPRTFVGGLLLWLVLTAIWIAFVKVSGPAHADRVDVLNATMSTASKLSGVYWGIWLVWIRRKQSDVKAGYATGRITVRSYQGSCKATVGEQAIGGALQSEPLVL